MVPANTPSPFISIWLHPRAMMRHILDTNPRRYVLLLAGAAGAFEVLDTAVTRRLGDNFGLPFLALLVLLIAPIGRILVLYLNGWLTHLTGSWFGGKGTVVGVRSALAWSNIPEMAMSAVIAIPTLLLYGTESFTRSRPHAKALIASNPQFATIVFVTEFATIAMALVFAVWTIVVTVVCLSEALRISVWRALAALLLGAVLAGVLVALLTGVGLLLAS